MRSDQNNVIQPSIAGDRHNFGRKVERLAGGSIFKPRPLIWEYMLLDNRSIVRQSLLAQGIWDFIPALEIDPSTSFINGGIAKEFVRSSAVGAFREIIAEDAARNMGRFLALSHWLGLSDLHFENIFFDVNMLDNTLLICPVDIEVVFKKLAFASETHLLRRKTMVSVYIEFPKKIRMVQWNLNWSIRV